jgi:hypothetical protein
MTTNAEQNEQAHLIPPDWVPETLPMRAALTCDHVERLQRLGYTCKATWPNAAAEGMRWHYITKNEMPTPLQVFDWAVVRQSALGPGLATAAAAFGCTTQDIREAVKKWDDPRGHMECVHIDKKLGAPVSAWRIEAYYNTTG